jgi:hypothetical protein
MGYSALPESMIEAGIAALAAALPRLPSSILRL